ncbi:MAG: ABC transporter permease [Bacteroidales bacterium]
MKKNKIFLIIEREFSIRVKKKSFIIMTILAPILFASMMVIPTLMMTMSDDSNDVVKVNVLDDSGIVMPYLTSNNNYVFKQISKADLDDFKKFYLGNSKQTDNEDVYLYISELDSTNNVELQTFSTKPVKMNVTSYLKFITKKAVEDYKIKLLNIPDIKNIVNSLNTNVALSSFEVDSEGKTIRSENTVYMVIGYITGFMIYMFIFMFGSMVMKSVIEEKTTRIIEVIISSVKPFETVK